LKFSFLFPIVLFATVLVSTPPAYAIPVEDIPASIWRAIKDVIAKSGSQIFNSVLTTAVNQLAYDYATYLGSGASGQKPFFEQKPLGDRILEAGDAALGQFVEDVAENGLWSPKRDENGNIIRNPDGSPVLEQSGDLNICSPDIFALNKITLGLTDYGRPSYETGSCSFSQLRSNWESEFDQITSIINDRDYLKKVSGYFDPGGNDIAISYELFNRASEEMILERSKEQQEAEENGGWIRVQGLVGKKYTDAPGTKERMEQQVRDIQSGAIGKYTGDVFVDAANIFLNQLALSAFNKLMGSIGADTSEGGGATNEFAQGGRGGALAIENKLNTIVQARFSDRTDYNILGELISCPDQENPGPTNCVITDSFSTAVSKGMTVIEAEGAGYLNGDYSFGFKGLNNEEPPYNQGYPYRSLVILRKYRILPVGWEVAAQYIQKNNKLVNPPVDTKDIRLIDLLRCFDPCDEYTGYNDGIGSVRGNTCSPSASPQNWCTGLVDPNWVLEVPKMYCKAQGYGPEIQNSQYINQGKFCSAKTDKACVDKCSNLSGNFDTSTCCQANEGECEAKTQLAVTRNQNYCADEQSCIKENSDGSCAYFGYCTEEKREWTFSQDNRNSCEAINNSCQTFTGNGKTVSYLENTLDYGSCGPNEVGCARYATDGTYNTTTKAVNWSTSTVSKYLNKNAESCDPDKEGCHQFIRAQDGGDTNLIADGSFEGSTCIGGAGGVESKLPQDKLNPLVNTAFAQTAIGDCELTTLNNSGTLPSPNNRWYIRVNSGSVNAGIVNDRADHGSQSLYIEGAGGIYSKDNTAPTLLPSGFAFEADRFYTLTATVYVTSGKVRIGFGGANGQFAESTATDAWQNLIVNYYRTANGATDFYVEGLDAGAKFYIDELKISVGNALTTYGDYFEKNVIYQKLLPKYLEAACYESVGGDAPGSSNYRYKTNAPSECFNFARKCNADEVGCEQYTSLNTGIAVTGKVKPKDYCPGSCVGYDVFVEQPTYFSAASSQYFIPSTANSCSAQATGCTAFTNLDKLEAGGEAVEYYTYLRSCIKPDAASCGEFYTWEGSDESGFQLKVYSLKQNGSEPASTMTPEEEALVCNEEIFKKSPSEPGYNYDCREFYNRDGQVSYHLYTRTISCSEDCHPYRREVASQAECEAGNGTWDITQSRCLYYAIPNQGTTCSAPEVGCREYTGNIANDTRIVLNDTFENSTQPTDNWGGGAQSNNSLNLGGHSLLGTNLSKTIGAIVTRDQSYTISFLAKVQAGNAVLSSIDLVNKDNQAAVFSTGSNVNISSEWKIYTFNLAKLDHEVTPIPSQGDAPDQGEKLRINFSQPVYIDNIVLTEVPDRYYLIKDSWTTPDECDQTVTGAYSPRYMLGCSQYRDRNNTTVNLHSFSQLCQDSAAGCEQMIDTQNSGDYRKRLYNDTNNNGVCEPSEASCVEVRADEMINVVYDRTKECSSGDKGCSRYGKASTYDNTTTYADEYKEDNPDTYNTTLCNQSAVGCQAWSTGSGTTYFKDPGNQACEYRLKKGTNSQYEWFRTLKLKRCGGATNGTVCTSNQDCSANQQCVEVDDPCPVSLTKTIGTGGAGNAVEQPTGGWAGLCAATQSGCTEYVDPVSRFNNNIIINPTYEDIGGVSHPGWNGNSQDMGSSRVEPNTLYILSGEGAFVEDWGNDELYQLDSNTNQFKLVNAQNPFKAVAADNSGNGSVNSVEFFVIAVESFDGFTVTRASNTPSTELKKAVVGYQLRQNLDRSPTTVDFKTGRILFNERRVAGSGMSQLTYNADYTSKDSPTGNTPSNQGPLNANVILKVSPNRSCSKWLSCRSFGTDPSDPNKQICFDIGQCTSMSPSGECENFSEDLELKNQTLTFANRDLFANMTGYSKVGYDGNILNADMYNLGTMKQVGGSASLNNPSFEEKGDWTGGTILHRPSDRQSVTYADGTLPDGFGLLKLTNVETSTQNSINLQADTTYIISAYVYVRSGDVAFRINNGTPDIFNTTNDLKGRWVRKLGTYKPSVSGAYSFSFVATGDGEKYIDDVRIESVLNNRCVGANCDGENISQRWYTASMCRLYPKADSLACQYEDDSNVVQKGWRGYCLETDPKNPQACLLWYPVDRIISEGSEEGAGLNISSDLSYCTLAQDRCTAATQGDQPEVFCQTFAKVDTDKYWRSRLIGGSNYVLPLPDGTIDLGYGGIGTNNTKIPISVTGIGRFSDESLYGGHDLNNFGQLATIQYNASDLFKMNPFLPYSAQLLTPGSRCDAGIATGDAQVCGECQNSNFPHGYEGGCPMGECGGSDRWECKENKASQFDQKFDTCTLNGGRPGSRMATDGQGRWGSITYGGNCESSSGRCYYFTQSYRIANSKNDADQAVRRLFASGNGDFAWNGNSYSLLSNTAWSTPGTECYQGKRPTYNTTTRLCTAADGVTVGSCISGTPGNNNSTNDYCYVRPTVFNLKVGRDSITSGTETVRGAGYVEFKFNSKVDPEQLPLTGYRIDWDEGATDPTENTNANMYDKPNETSPHVFRHYYSYEDLKDEPARCPTGSNYCVVRPRIRITDNWGKFHDFVSPVEIKVFQD